MLEEVKILTSRRAYEFSQDALRLSSISIQPVQLQIQKLFNFQSSMFGTPMASFGEVPSTFPPGVVFDMGAWVYREEHIVPIRFIHFEPARIVIDVAGPTVAIDDIADHLFNFLSGLKAADGSPVIGEPIRVLEYSEITVKFPYSLDVIVAKPLQKLLNKTIHSETSHESMVILPALSVQVSSIDKEVPAVLNPGDPFAFSFSIRIGTRPKEHICFSSAPLSSEKHLVYLEELVTLLKP